MESEAESCGTNTGYINSEFSYLGKQLQAKSSPEDMYNLLMSEDFFNQVNGLATLVKKIKLDTIKCMGGNNQQKICQGIDALDSAVNLKNLENMLNVINKYNTMLTEMTQWIFMNIHDLYKYCEKDPQKVIAIKQIITKISYILSDQVAMSNLFAGDNYFAEYMPESERVIVPSHKYNDNVWMLSTSFLFIVVVVLIFLVVYLYNLEK